MKREKEQIGEKLIGAVVLAAGESERMGKDKLLLEIKGKKVIELVIDALKDVVDDIIVVLGYKPRRLIPILKRQGVRWTINEKYEEGMTSSFKNGLQETQYSEAVFLVLGDQPSIDGDFLIGMISAWKEKGAKIVSPVYKGKKGHPVLFDESLFDEIMSLKKGEIIRDIIHRHGGEIHLIEAGEWSVMDMDTPEGFEKMKKYVKAS